MSLISHLTQVERGERIWVSRVGCWTKAGIPRRESHLVLSDPWQRYFPFLLTVYVHIFSIRTFTAYLLVPGQGENRTSEWVHGSISRDSGLKHAP